MKRMHRATALGLIGATSLAGFAGAAMAQSAPGAPFVVAQAQSDQGEAPGHRKLTPEQQQYLRNLQKQKQEQAGKPAQPAATAQQQPQPQPGAAGEGQKRPLTPEQQQYLRKLHQQKQEQAGQAPPRAGQTAGQPGQAGPAQNATAQEPAAKNPLLPQLTAQQRQALQARQQKLRQELQQAQQQNQQLQHRNTALQNRNQTLQNRNAAMPGPNAAFEEQTARLQRQAEWVRARQQQAHQNRNLPENLRWYQPGDVVRRGPNATIIRRGDQLVVFNTNIDRFRWNARNIATQPLRNGWTQTVIVRPNGQRVVTVRDADGLIVRRYGDYNGRRVVYFDNRPAWWTDNSELVVNVPPPPPAVIQQPWYVVQPSQATAAQVYRVISAPPVLPIDRPYTLDQVLTNQNLRAYMPRVDLDSIHFATGSAELPADQLQKLEKVGAAMQAAIRRNPNEVFLVAGYTDAVGDPVSNLELSDRRAQAVADALTNFFDIPPENLVTHGYGEQFLKVATQGPSQANRRVEVQRITPLLGVDSQAVAQATPNE